MKKILLATLLGLASCSTAIKDSLSFPEAMHPEVRAQYAKLCEKGRVLYQMNCARCHNLGRRKDIIPDFDAEQLRGYEIRVSNKQHEQSMPDEVVTAEELALISTFLQYKTPSGHHSKSSGKE